jgi:hypothetical protein
MDKTAPPEKLREWENPRTGEVLQVPDGVHPAFVGNPGKDRAAALKRASADKLRAVPADMAAAARRLLGGDGSAA